MSLMFLRDGHLGVLFAGILYLLRENAPWGLQFTVFDDLDVGSDAILFSHASTNRSIFVLCDLDTTDPDSDAPYSIRELSLPVYNAS